MPKTKRRRPLRKLRLLALLVAATFSLAGCGLFPSAYDLPLPGGADVGSHPITLSADFGNVMDLVPQSSVKVDNVDVGKVTEITLNPGGRTAHVTLEVNGNVRLPEGTTARLKQTTLLGEKYVALDRPENSSGPLLHSGAQLGLAKTSQAADVEQVLGALSALLNGGDIGKFQEVSRELTRVSAGRSDQIRSFLTQMRTFVSSLNDRRHAITDALDGLNALSQTLDAEKGKIVTALDGLSPGMKVIANQRQQLTAMLQALDHLSGVTVATLNKSQADIVADFKKLKPILAQLANAGRDLPNALQILLTYPFPDSVLGAIKGDYLNAFITTNFRTPSGCDKFGCAWPQPAIDDGSGTASPNARMFSPHMLAPSLLPPTSSAVPGIPTPSLTAPSKSPSQSASSSPSPDRTPGTSPTKTPSTSPSTSPSKSSSSSPSDTASPSPTGTPTSGGEN